MWLWAIGIPVFATEVIMVAAIGRGGYRLAGAGVGAWCVAVLAVLATCVLWGMYAAPRSSYDVPAAALAVKIGCYGLATVAVAYTQTVRWAVVFAVVSLILNVVAAVVRPGGV